MIVQGVDTSTLPDTYQNAVQGRVLILDGDGPCYVASATAKRLDTAIRYFQQEVLKRMFLAQCSECRIHLTPSGSDKHGRFRVKAAKPYQGNRDNKAKPSLLEPLRQAVQDNSTWLDDYEVQSHMDVEADDAMMRDAYHFKENGVINSDDKDLRMTPWLYYEQERGQVMAAQPVGFVTMKHTPGGTAKCVGQGPMFFWAQMLMGDTADNIAGVRKYKGALCGPIGAYGALKDVTNINVAANLVIDAYRAIDQNVVAEGWLLWLTRWHKDNVVNYYNELDLTEPNKAFVLDCLHRDWVIPKEAASASDTNI